MNNNQNPAAKLFVASILLLFGPLLIIGLLYIIGSCASEADRKERNKERSEYVEKANNAINQGDYSTAYDIVDQMKENGYGGSGYDLNKRALTNEIAENIETANAAKIIICIKERAGYNQSYDWDRRKEEKEMLKHAIQLAEAIDDSVTAQKLQTALDSWESN